MTTNIIDAIDAATDAAYDNDGAMAVYYDRTSGNWLVSDPGDASQIYGKIWLEVGASGVGFLDDETLEMIASVDEEAIPALKAAGIEGGK